MLLMEKKRERTPEGRYRPSGRPEAIQQAGLSLRQAKNSIRIASIDGEVLDELIKGDNSPTVKELAEIGTRKHKPEPQQPFVRAVERREGRKAILVAPNPRTRCMGIGWGPFDLPPGVPADEAGEELNVPLAQSPASLPLADRYTVSRLHQNMRGGGSSDKAPPPRRLMAGPRLCVVRTYLIA